MNFKHNYLENCRIFEFGVEFSQKLLINIFIRTRNINHIMQSSQLIDRFQIFFGERVANKLFFSLVQLDCGLGTHESHLLLNLTFNIRCFLLNGIFLIIQNLTVRLMYQPNVRVIFFKH
jgi:hypothetical protein